MAKKFLTSITISASSGGEYTFPIADGTANQAIITDGDGNLSFGSAVASSAEDAQRLVCEMINASGSTIGAFLPVCCVGMHSDGTPEIAPARADNALYMPAIGVTQASVGNNNRTDVLLYGKIENVNTTAYQTGDTLYVAPTGGWTTTRPTGTNYIQAVLKVGRVHANNGSGGAFGAGKYEDLPNLGAGKIWVGDSSSYPVATSIAAAVTAAYGYTPADDSGVVKLTGNQTVAGVKTFTSVVNAPTLSLNGGVLAGNNIVSMRSNPTGGQFRIEKSDGSLSAYPFYIGADGTALAYYYNAAGALKVLLHTDNTSYFGNSLSVGYSTYATTSYMLDVNGTARLTGALTGTSATFSSDLTALSATINGSTHSYLNLNAANAGGNEAGIYFKIGGTSKWEQYTAANDGNLNFWNNGNGIRFILTPSGGATFASSINTGGDVTIATGSIKLYTQQNVSGQYRYIGTEYSSGNGNNKAEIRFGIDGSDTKTKITFHTANGGGQINEVMGAYATGQFKLNNYTSATSFSGTAAGYLAFDSSGNVITVAGVAATDNTKLPLTGGALTGPLTITGNGSYLGDWGYKTLELNDTSGYAGIFFKNGANIWITRRNGADNAMDWAYSTNATAQGTGTFTQKMRLASDEWWVSTYPNYKMRVTGGDVLETLNGTSVTTLYLQYHSNTGGNVNIAASKFIFENVNNRLLFSKTSGTLISHGSMTDAIGYNASYGTYIGSPVGGTYYLYANGTFSDQGTIRTLIHTGNIGSYTAGAVAWANITAGTRTNYTLGFEPPVNDYAGLKFTSTTGDGAGYLLIRGTSDSDIYTAEGITLVADRGWLTLAQRTTASKGVRIMTGVSSSVRFSISTSGDITSSSGITYTAGGGSVLMKHSVAEVDAWIFQENAANWGLYYKNNPTGQHTFGGYTTVGAETVGMSAANVSGNGILTSNFVGATTAYAQWMLSNYTGYIWSASTIFAATSFAGKVPGSSYGSIRVDGTTGDYAGIYLSGASGTVTGMYDTGGNGGDWDPTTGWHFYWHRGNTCLALGGSTTSSSYRVYANGAMYVSGSLTMGSSSFMAGGASYVANGANNSGGFAMNNSGQYWGLMWNFASDDWRLGRGSQTAQNGWNLRWDSGNNVFVNQHLYLNNNYGSTIVGAYESTRYQGVFAMGDAYKLPLDGTGPGNLYGLSWSHPNAGGQAGYLNNHGLLVMVNGSTQAAISSNIWARGNITSNGGMYSSDWFRAYGDTGLYTQDYGGHFRRNATSYGTWQSFGYAKNGWGGYVTDNNYILSLMNNSGGDHGFHMENGRGWTLFHNYSNNCWGIGTDNTYSGDGFRCIKYGSAEYGWTTWSDRRAKENISSITGALDTVLAMRGVYFNYIKDEAKNKRVGFIAQELELVLPEAVRYAEEIDEYSVEYAQIVSVLAEAIKEQNIKIQGLEAQLQTLLN